MAPEKREFLIQGEDGKEYGPAGFDELREWVRENRAGLGTLVRRDEPHTIWEPWQHFPELVALVAEMRAAGPAPDAAGLTLAPLSRRILAGVADVILSHILSVPVICIALILTIPNLQEQMPNLQQQMLRFYSAPQNPVPEPLLSFLVGYYLIVYSVLTVYMAGFHAVRGQTPAKMLMRLRVVGPDGGNPPFVRSLLRGFLFSLSIYLCGFPLLYVLFSPHRRALHDYAANTCVVEA
jgi:uncharacterized RDD family membrane protein YckC